MEKLDKKISDKILYAFNSAKEWSDLMSVIKDLIGVLGKFGNENFRFIQDKITLSRRMAQCLSPILPAGLHTSALDCYDVILENIISKNNGMLGEDLALYSSGLFPFFPLASNENKKKVLKIFKERFLHINVTELELCLPGLLVSALPGLEEQDEAIHKPVKEIFNSLREQLSDRTFFGCLWSIIIRNQKLRLSGMKYIYDTIPQYKIYEESSEEQQKEYIQKYYPMMDTMVINTLCAVIEDTEVQVQRSGMDFLIKSLPVNADESLLSNENKIVLLMSALNLLVKNEYSTTRRLSQWILGTTTIDDEIDLENKDTKDMIALLIAAFKRIFNVEDTSKDKLKSHLKVIEQLLSQQVSLADAILENISYDIIMCIVNYWDVVLNENESAGSDEVIQKTKFFFNKDSSFIEWLWIGLAKNLAEFNAKAGTSSFNVIALIEKAIKPLKFCLLYINITSNENKVRFYIPIISNLLKIMMSFNISSRDSLKDIRHIIFIALVFTKSLQETTIVANPRTSVFVTVATSIEQNLGDKIQDIAELIKSKFNISPESSLVNILQNPQYKEILAQFTENVLSFQKEYIQIVEQLLQVQSENLSRTEMRTFKQATELIIRTQEYAQQEEVPQWLIYLEKATFGENIQLSLEGSHYIINLLLIELKGSTYNQIKDDIRRKEVDENVISKDKLERLISISRIKPNTAEILMAMLWSLIEDQANQKTVIDLLITFSKTDLEIFINTIANTFVENDFDKNVNAIKKFSQFWKCTNEFYPELIFFKNGECIFKMLDFLDHEHPLLRHLSKSWLNQSVGQFNKILDPLLAVLFSKETSWKLADKKIYFDREYDNRRIMDTFRKLKNIIINITDLAIKYFVNNKASSELLVMDTFGDILDKNQLGMPRSNYLELMVSISLRFIQGKVVAEISQSFSRENYSVNAASCEFLEFLLSFIEPKKNLMKIASHITLPVLEILYQTIEDRDEVMQVQLLNLLKVLLFTTHPEHENFKKEAINMFNNTKLRECLIKGIQTKYFFVRGHFIYFLECCLPMFKENLDLKAQQEMAVQLINTTTDFLIQRVTYSKGVNKEVHKFSHANAKYNMFVFKNYLEEYKEYKRFDENDINIIVKGLKEILFHFLEIKQSYQSKTTDWVVFKKNFLNQFKSNSSFGDYLSALFSKDDFDEKVKETNPEMKQNIYGILGDLLTTFLIAWVNQSEVYEDKDYCLNNNGILAYLEGDAKTGRTSEDTSILSDDNKRQVKSQIVEISFNLFMKNPLDFINHFIDLWRGSSNNTLAKDKQYKLSMIELLIAMNIPMNIIFLTIGTMLNKIPKFSYSKGNTKNYITPYSISVIESQICLLLYSYILLNNKEKERKGGIAEIWNELLTILEFYLKNSKISNTMCWLYEILNMMVNKYPIAITNDESIKKRAIDLYYNLNKKLMDISFNGKFESVYESPASLVVPILPSIYTNTVFIMFPGDNLYLKRDEAIQMTKDSDNSNNLLRVATAPVEPTIDFTSPNVITRTTSARIGNTPRSTFSSNTLTKNEGYVIWFYRGYYEAISQAKKSNTSSNNMKDLKQADELQTIYRKLAFLTLRYNYYSIAKNVYLDRPAEIGKNLNSLIKNLISMMNTNGQTKNDNNKFYAELATEFLQSLMNDSPDYTSLAGKTTIMEYFTSDSFFKTTPRIIRLWKDIISNLSSKYSQIIDDLIGQMNSGFLFIKGSNETKIKTLRRISFVIYSCEKDTFSNKLQVFKEKVKDLFTSYGDIPILESEIFLMIRVLFLRFSHDNIMDMIKALWPIILSELVSIMQGKKKNKPITLLLESFKFVELLSLANIEEFSLYQWIFIIDTFDVKRLDTTDEKSLLSSLLGKETKIFKPIGMNVTANWKSEVKFKGNGRTKNELIIVNQTQNEDDLVSSVKKFFYSIGDMNNFKVKVNFNQIEEVIEADFLNKNEEQ